MLFSTLDTTYRWAIATAATAAAVAALTNTFFNIDVWHLRILIVCGMAALLSYS